jgi:hypothetical protein
MVGVVMVTGKVSDFTEHVGLPVIVALIALAASLMAAALSFALARWNDGTARRREGYAAATRELVAWAEYPYRIKRRTSDDLTALHALADRGHVHQEALRYRETWIISESKWVSEVFGAVRLKLAELLGPACNDAWASGPVVDAAGMRLRGWGPQEVDEHIKRFERAVAFRFGWRRILALFGWHPGA